MDSASRPTESRQVRWRVVVGEALAEVAERLRVCRTVMTCVDCGRRGRIVEVVVWGQTHAHRPRRGAQPRRRQRGDDGA